MAPNKETANLSTVDRKIASPWPTHTHLASLVTPISEASPQSESWYHDDHNANFWGKLAGNHLNLTRKPPWGYCTTYVETNHVVDDGRWPKVSLQILLQVVESGGSNIILARTASCWNYMNNLHCLKEFSLVKKKHISVKTPVAPLHYHHCASWATHVLLDFAGLDEQRLDPRHKRNHLNSSVTVIVSEKSAPFSWASKIPAASRICLRSWAKLAKGVPHVTRRKTHFVRQRLWGQLSLRVWSWLNEQNGWTSDVVIPIDELNVPPFCFPA